MIGTFLYQLLLFSILSDQPLKSNLQDERVYTISEVTTKPEPPGGLAAFQKTWSQNVRYPEEAVRSNIQGLVFIEFIVRRDGMVEQSAVRCRSGPLTVRPSHPCAR